MRSRAKFNISVKEMAEQLGITFWVTRSSAFAL